MRRPARQVSNHLLLPPPVNCAGILCVTAKMVVAIRCVAVTLTRWKVSLWWAACVPDCVPECVSNSSSTLNGRPYVSEAQEGRGGPLRIPAPRSGSFSCCRWETMYSLWLVGIHSAWVKCLFLNPPHHTTTTASHPSTDRSRSPSFYRQ